jgi:Putative zinc binding domain
MSTCRGCGGTHLSRVLDLSKVTAAQHFPLVTEPVRSEESSNPLAMDLCIRCGFAQLAHDDDIVTAELRRIGAASTAGEDTAR